MINYIIYSIALFYAVLIFYLAIMNISRHKDKLNSIQKAVFAPILIIGLLLDVLFRYTVGILIDLPSLTKDDLLFTSVLQRYVNTDTWRGKVCRFLCHNFLDWFDPSGKHC